MIDKYYEEITIESSKDGKEIIRIIKDDKKIYLGSRYNVARDIENIKAKVKKAKKNANIIIIGLATGEYIGEIKKHIDDSKSVTVIEPNVNIYNKYKPKDNYKNINIYNFIDNFDINPNSALEFIVYSGYEKVYPEFICDIQKNIVKSVKGNILRRKTDLKLAKSWANNTIKNLYNISQSINLYDLKNFYKKRPAIVVSAGPSLSKNINLLKEVENDFVIIAGNRTLKPLLDIGIKPDFVCVVDGGDVPYTNMKPYFKNTKDINLVYIELVNSEIAREFQGTKIFHTFERDIYNILKNKEAINIDAGGSVAHYATSIARYIGCDPIVFIGQDLAYTDNKKHSENAEDYKVNFETVKRADDIFVKDIYGNEIRTSEIFNFYKDQMEDIINRAKENHFINATEGGVDIKGTKVSDLKSVISEYKSDNIKPKINGEIYEKAIELQVVKKFLKESIKFTEILRKEVETAARYNEKIKSIDNKGHISKIKNINKNLIKDNKKIFLLEKLLKAVMEILLYDNDLVVSGNEDKGELLEKIYIKNRIFYKGIKEACTYILPIIKEEIDLLERVEEVKNG